MSIPPVTSNNSHTIPAPPPEALKESKQPLPPVAIKVHTIHEAHGHQRVDDYHWLRNKKDPDTISFLQDWNDYTEKALEAVKPLSDKLFEEFVSRIEPNDQSVPYKIGSYFYYTRQEDGKEHPIYCRYADKTYILIGHYKEGNKKRPIYISPASYCKTEEIILDGNEMAKEEAFFNVIGFEPSPNGKYIAFAVDNDGSQFGKVMIQDMETGKFLGNEVIPESDGGIVWNSTSTGIWYTQVDSQMRTDKVRFHTIGKPIKEDPIIHSEKDVLFTLEIDGDKLDRHLIITSSSKDSSEILIGKLDNPTAPFQTIQPKEEGLLVFFCPGDQEHYLLISKDRGNWGLAKVKGENLGKMHWEEAIPASTLTDLIEVEVFKDHLALIKRVQGLLRVEIHSLKDGEVHEVQLPQEICEVGFSHNETFDTPYLRFCFSSPVTPDSVYRYHMDEKKLELLKQQKAGSFDPSLYTTERVWATADDGVKIPITLYHKKGLKRDGTAPFYLYGYGSYGVSYDPSFSNVEASFLERGAYCAIAHIRGGGDLGQQWYKEGCMLKKKNSFTDFICCAEYLIQEGYTCPDRLAIEGRSAGGLLMGAVINARPDLFKVCFAGVPFVDVVTTMFDETLPLTKEEWVEWGNPNDKEYYDYMLSYSPFDQVKAQDYPSLLITAGLNDNQVSYHEPAKWVAKLREFKTDSNPLLFQINMKAGHRGASGRYSKLEETAPWFAFLMSEIGLNN